MNNEPKMNRPDNYNRPPMQQHIAFGPARGGGGPGGRMAQEVIKPANFKATLIRVIKYFKENLKLFTLLITAVIIATVCSLFVPSMQGKAIDSIFDSQYNRLYLLIILLVVAYVVTALSRLVQTKVSVSLGQNIGRKMRNDLFAKISKLPIAYMDSHPKGELMSIMTYDVDNIATSISQSLSAFISGIMILTGTIIFMFYLCWQLTLITMVTVIFTVLMTKVLSKVMRVAYKRKSRVLGALNGYAEEMITGQKTIVAYNRQDTTINTFNKFSNRVQRVGFRADILASCVAPLLGTISNISFVIVAGFGGWFTVEGLISIGTISAFIIYVKQFTRPLNEIAQLFGSIQTAIASAERVFEVLDLEDENKEGTQIIDNIKGEIKFQKVNFSYIPGKQVLYDFDLDIHPGQKIALVGATGSGKTTVVNLLMRFYNLDSGQILIDGKNIMDINRDWLRQNVAIVLQDTVLFSDTIANNIKYANPVATDDQMLQASKMSNSHPFIELLPNQYNTYLSRAGESLSQGERQLLNIARAILANPRILVLDEATSSVDTRTEVNIQDAMVNLMKNRTSIIIAHRLSTIRDADKIIVMDKGRIVEIGNHQQLLATKGKYYSLYNQQFSGYQI